MVGGLFAGLAESPGEQILYQGRTFKVYRGMGSLGAMVKGSSERYRQKGSERAPAKLVPEGVEGRVPFKGPLSSFVYQLVGGLRAGMGYCGTQTIEELRTKTRFIQITSAGVRESHPHDIAITQEASNYSSTQGHRRRKLTAPRRHCPTARCRRPSGCAALLAATLRPHRGRHCTGQVQADGGPPPLFLAPRTASAIASSDASDVEQASRERLQERAAAVSNPNLKWKPYRPAPKAGRNDIRPRKNRRRETGRTKRRPPTRCVRASDRGQCPPSEQNRCRRRCRADAEIDAIADAAPARRTAARSSRSQLREEILQVDQREKPDPFNDSFDNDRDASDRTAVPGPARATPDRDSAHDQSDGRPVSRRGAADAGRTGRGNYAPPSSEPARRPSRPTLWLATPKSANAPRPCDA